MEKFQLLDTISDDDDDLLCPICLNFPHNTVLLQCSSLNKGCRPFVCDTDHFLSNCLNRFRNAHGMSDSISPENTCSLSDEKPLCPLCRGEVTGWIVIDETRKHMNEKERCCEEHGCLFTGTYLQLQEHAKKEHPHGCPAKIDPVRQLDWENFQQSSETIDVLNTIHAGIPHGVVLGDYVIEYGDNDSGDDEFRRDKRNWFTSCILFQVCDNVRSSRNRRRFRADRDRRRRSNQQFESQFFDYGVESVTSIIGSPDYRNNEIVGFQSSGRRSSRLFES
ncbi:uncharacterized protein LOC124942822 [Impatiens glandulifera]|uniref:uncharacterized protein LOC124942822 n=1 Tax=Impatiens glandulifera TaxID=253017 RepID=UPI001FB0A470|nr:uncharacterized protein LOC124942822 [Impatiens glandulifera]